MAKTPPVLVTVVLDRSGSMGSCVNETIEGFNSYLEGMKAEEGETYITLRQFDDKHDVVYSGKKIQDAPSLTHETFVPRGGTALNDAIARGIFGADEAKIKGAKHLLVIITDGHENQSVEYGKEAIKTLVSNRQKKGWTVVFLQGNLDLQSAQRQAAFYGVSAGNTLSYSNATTSSNLAMATSLRAVTETAGTGTSTAFADANVAQDVTDEDDSPKAA